MLYARIILTSVAIALAACGDDQASMNAAMGGAAAPAGPCDETPCGQPCSVCTPDDTMCTPPMVATFCNAQKQCVAADLNQLSCMADEIYNPCAGKTCGQPCSVCAPGTTECSEPSADTYCSSQLQCLIGDPITLCPPESTNPDREPPPNPNPPPTIQTRACSELSPSWMSGQATCPEPCRQYDVSDCTRAELMNAKDAEWIIPAQRNPDRWSEAVCNDGTPFGFQVRLSPRPNVKDWVIAFGGAGMCDESAFRCRTRSNSTTPTGPDGMPVGDRSLAPLVEEGIFDAMGAINPRFADAHMVLARYCSNDLWTGTTTNPKEIVTELVDMVPMYGTWTFAGSINLLSVFEALIERFGLDDQDPSTRILVIGSSAGGAGIIANAHTVAGLLPQTTTGRRLRILLDGFFLPEWTGYESDDMGSLEKHYLGSSNLPDVATLSNALSFWEGTVNAACSSTAGANQGYCLIGPAAIKYLAAPAPNGLNLPTLVQQHIFDALLLRDRRILTNDCRVPECIPGPLKTAWRTAMTAGLATPGLNWAFVNDTGTYNTLSLGDSTWSLASTIRADTKFSQLVLQFFESETPDMGIKLMPE